MRSSRSSLRTLGCGLAVAGVLVVVVALLPTDRPARTVQAPAAPERTAAVAVLHEWDAARAAAWREGDLRQLRDLYVGGSRVGRADVALLAAYVDRGMTVRGMRMQVAAVEVVSAADDRVELRVTDRMVGATATGHGRTFPLPQDRWSRRRVVLVRVADDWRVAAVSS